ncbi:DUF1802 family protein [Verrucomicrobium sp. 3C]|uniref:DUF1802 family protein n=1 Tax=Verrucomicrobium sp. 3C TaxID=1134055 RepID=UPI001E4BBC6B|nr:DUF1802 family protein [Verrucomicrobium sp. 3C]
MQSIILRKGGIMERRGGFTTRYADFWLLPTRFHAQAEKMRPEFRFLAEGRDGTKAEAAELQYVAKLVWSRWIADWTPIRRLSRLQLWEEELLRERFAYGGKEGLHLLMLRVYRSAKVICPWKRDLGGCRSWVALRHPWSEALVPVLSDGQFGAREREALAAVAGG